MNSLFIKLLLSLIVSVLFYFYNGFNFSICLGVILILNSISNKFIYLYILISTLLYNFLLDSNHAYALLISYLFIFLLILVRTPRYINIIITFVAIYFFSLTYPDHAYLIGQNLWFIIFALIYPYQNIKENTALISPLISFSGIPFAKSKTFLDKYKVKESSLIKLQLKAILFITIGVTMNIGIHYLLKLQFKYDLPMIITNLSTVSTSWFSLVLYFIYDFLYIMMSGYLFVSIIWFLGFNIPSNTQMPFLSTNILDFFNKYNYYFKEILADVFFKPSFLFFNNLGLRSRLLVSTLMSAMIGNFIFHFSSTVIYSREASIEEILLKMKFFPLYSLILAIGIYLSQISLLKKKTKKTSLSKKVLYPILTTLFFMLITPLSIIKNDISLDQMINFYLSLFGLNT